MSIPPSAAEEPARPHRRRIVVASLLVAAAALVVGYLWINQSENRAGALLRELVRTQEERSWFSDALRGLFGLHDSPARSRYAVARDLADLGPAVVPRLITALTDQNPDARWAAAQALGLIGDRRATQPLAAALAKDSNDDVAESAAEALGRIGDPAAAEALTAAATKRAPSVRRAAVTSLGQLGDAKIMPVLLVALHDETSVVAQAAARALGELGNAEAVQPLLKVLENSDADLASCAAAALGQLGDPQATPALVAAAGNASPRVRQAAAEALGETGGPKALPWLLKTLADPDANVRESAARALGLLGDREACRSLEVALADTEGRVRFWAAVSLGALGTIPSSGFSEEGTVPLSSEAKGAAPVSPKPRNGDSPQDALTPLLEDKDNLVRPAAAFAMALLGRAEAVPVLKESLGAKAEWAAWAAVVGLARMDTPESRQALQGRAAIQDAGVRRFAGEVGRGPLRDALVAELGRPHTDSGANTAYFAASSLEYVGDATCLPALREALRSRDADVRASARRAIRRIERLAPPK